MILCHSLVYRTKKLYRESGNTKALQILQVVYTSHIANVSKSKSYQASTSNNSPYSYNTLNCSNSQSFSYCLEADLLPRINPKKSSLIPTRFMIFPTLDI
jgi:hypothetical protein